MFDIIERTGQAEYYLREARRAGLPMPGYVTVSYRDHGSFQSSQIGIQLASRAEVAEWALHFGAEISDGAASAELERGTSHAYHDVNVYCGAEETALVAS